MKNIIVKIKAGKEKGKTRFVDDWNFKSKSKYRKVRPNRFNSQKRFLSLLDLAEAKHAEAITNSQIKRGERKRGNLALHYVCGCGVEGCIGHNEYQQEGQASRIQSEFK